MVLIGADCRQVGIECPMTTLEQYMKAEDWSAVYGS